SAVIQKEEKSPEKDSLEKGHSNDIKQEADLEKGHGNDIKQQETESAVIQKEEKSPEKDSVAELEVLQRSLKDVKFSLAQKEEDLSSAEKRLRDAEADKEKLKEKLKNVESALREKEELESLKKEMESECNMKNNPK
ncbi:hypothetical protein AMECASPLE_032382, partial [Ameca splendens]